MKILHYLRTRIGFSRAYLAAGREDRGAVDPIVKACLQVRGVAVACGRIDLDHARSTDAWRLRPRSGVPAPSRECLRSWSRTRNRESGPCNARGLGGRHRWILEHVRLRRTVLSSRDLFTAVIASAGGAATPLATRLQNGAYAGRVRCDADIHDLLAARRARTHCRLRTARREASSSVVSHASRRARRRAYPVL